MIAKQYNRDIRAEIISAYPSSLIRFYSSIRFKILNERLIREIGQYLPKNGTITDIGCGFGLFALYFAKLNPGLKIVGFDLNPKRIDTAKEVAKYLNVKNVTFEARNASLLAYDELLDGAYMIDIIHHIPLELVRPLLEHVFSIIRPGARLIIKDIDANLFFKRCFTHVLDKVMDWTAHVHYWKQQELLNLLQEIGYTVYSHSLSDYLPYPHALYVCIKN